MAENILTSLGMSPEQLISFIGVLAILFYMNWKTGIENKELKKELRDEREYSRQITEANRDVQVASMETMRNIKHAIEMIRAGK